MSRHLKAPRTSIEIGLKDKVNMSLAQGPAKEATAIILRDNSSFRCLKSLNFHIIGTILNKQPRMDKTS